MILCLLDKSTDCSNPAKTGQSAVKFQRGKWLSCKNGCIK